MHVALLELRWEDVDPRRHPFDPARARAIAERVVPPFAPQLPATRDRIHEDPAQTRCEEALELALIEGLGAWAAGWNWAASEPGGGGPVNAWCCGRDSILREGEPVEATIARVVAAVSEWHAFLEELSEMQASLSAEVKGLPGEDAVELVASRYVPLVIARTRAEDAWYGTYRRVVRWHFQALGHDDERITQTLRAVTSGRFQSWVEPTDEVIAEVSAALGLQLAPLLAEPPAQADALAQWLTLRDGLDLRDRVRSFEPTRADGQLAFIEAHDLPRSAERAARMGDALAFMRAHASQPLDWALLVEAQRRVLGRDDLSFRRGEAFAHGGRQRYGLGPGTRARFERCLAEANDGAVPPQLRAARVFLDLCFFHPFDDGNARAARLALDHLLTGAGLALRVAEPLFIFACRADNPSVFWHFSYLLERLLGKRGEAAPSPR